MPPVPPRSASVRWSLHVAAWVVGVAAFRIVLTPPERCPEIDAADLDAAITAAASWAATNQADDGRYAYGYHRDTDELSSAYNLVRHAGMVSALFQAVAAGEDRWLTTADAGLGFMLDHLVETGGGGLAFAYEGAQAKIGAAGLLVTALAHRREATGDDVHDDVMVGAGRFLQGQIEPSGSILGFWDPATGRPVPDRYATFGTGEAFWALAVLEDVFPGRGWGDSAADIGAYIATERRSDQGYWLRQPDHWAAYGFAERAFAVDDAEIEYLRRLAGDFGVMTRFESTRQGGDVASAIRGGPALGAGVGALGEGLGALWRLAGEDDRLADLRDDLDERLRCVAGMLVDRQVDEDEAATARRPDLAAGAWFLDDYTQVDDQQHALSALLVARRAVTGR